VHAVAAGGEYAGAEGRPRGGRRRWRYAVVVYCSAASRDSPQATVVSPVPRGWAWTRQTPTRQAVLHGPKRCPVSSPGARTDADTELPNIVVRSGRAAAPQQRRQRQRQHHGNSCELRHRCEAHDHRLPGQFRDQARAGSPHVKLVGWWAHLVQPAGRAFAPARRPASGDEDV
jgi:hypothetical protein